MELLGYNMENLTADHSCECIRRVSWTMHAEDPINIFLIIAATKG